MSPEIIFTSSVIFGPDSCLLLSLGDVILPGICVQTACCPSQNASLQIHRIQGQKSLGSFIEKELSNFEGKNYPQE